MGKFQLNKKGEDPIKIYEDTFKIAEGTVETHLDKLGKQPKPISRESDDTSRFEADIENDQLIQKLPTDKRSFNVESDGTDHDNDGEAKEGHLDNIYWKEARDSGLPIIDKGRYYECDGKMVYWDGQEAWEAENFLKYNSIKGESKASEDSDGKDHDNDGDIDSEDYLKSRDIAIKSNTEEKYINALWKSVEAIASED